MGNFRVALRTNYVTKNGKMPLIGKFSKNGKVFQTNLNVTVDRKNWSDKRQIILSKEEDFEIKNLYVRNAKKRAEDIMLKYQVNGACLTIDDFKKEFLIKEKEEEVVVEEVESCFYKFAAEEIEIKKAQIETSTYKQYLGEISKLKRFKKELKLEDMNSYNFFQSYEYYMRSKLKNKTNTITKSLKKLKVLLRLAYKKGYIKEFKADDYKLKYEKSNRPHLSLHELKKIEALIKTDIPEKVKNSLRCFLFSCYTGLRYNDLYNLKYRDIADGFITIKMEKTDEVLSLPLSQKALSLIDNERKVLNEKVMVVYSNQKVNDYLKVGLLMAGIHKKISFHCARHTFATISLNLSIPINVVSKFLGHNDIKTTQIYAKLLEETKIAEMSKWDNV